MVALYIFGMLVELVLLCASFVGRGHRSKFSVTGYKNVPFLAESESEIRKSVTYTLTALSTRKADLNWQL